MPNDPERYPLKGYRSGSFGNDENGVYDIFPHIVYGVFHDFDDDGQIYWGGSGLSDNGIGTHDYGVSEFKFLNFIISVRSRVGS